MSIRDAEMRLGTNKALRMRDVADCGPTPVGSPLNVTDIRVFEWGDRAEVRLAAERQGRARLHLSPIETARTQDTSASLSSRDKQGHPPRFGDLELVGNQTAAARATRTFDVGGARVSPTANLITFSRPSTTGGRRRSVATLNASTDWPTLPSAPVAAADG